MADELMRFDKHEYEDMTARYLSLASGMSLEDRGIRVLSRLEAAQLVGKSKRHLARLERLGEMPRRRRISMRLTGYLSHELQGLAAELVVVLDPRTLSREQIAGKLGVNERTLARLVRQGEMPPPVDGRWFERDIDIWLLSRPLV